MLLTILTISSLSLSEIYSQSNESEFVQFIMTNLETREKSLEIDHFMRSQKGVEISRADLHSKKYICIYNPAMGITLEQILGWMDKMSVNYKCVRTGHFGSDQIIDQKIDCDKE